MGLKSLVEDLRLSTLSRTALHQAQLDVHYLRSVLPRCAGLTVAGLTVAVSPSMRACMCVLCISNRTFIRLTADQCPCTPVLLWDV